MGKIAKLAFVAGKVVAHCGIVREPIEDGEEALGGLGGAVEFVEGKGEVKVGCLETDWVARLRGRQVKRISEYQVIIPDRQNHCG